MATVEQKKLHIWLGAGPPHDMKMLYLENFLFCILINKDSIKQKRTVSCVFDNLKLQYLQYQSRDL